MLKRIPFAFGVCAVAASLSLFCSGCAHNKVHAAAPVTVSPTPPAPVATQDTTKSPASIPAPNTGTPASPVSTTSAPTALNPKPDNPKRPVTTPPAASADQDHPAAPQISPQISASDQSQLQQQANQYVATTTQNLHHADGRDLNATQKDMVDKIRGWLDQAQQAIQTSDWERAKNLSEKAYLLSLDLLKTL
jgi:hypothetical protein